VKGQGEQRQPEHDVRLAHSTESTGDLSNNIGGRFAPGDSTPCGIGDGDGGVEVGAGEGSKGEKQIH